MSGLLASLLLGPAWGVKAYEASHVLLNAPAARVPSSNDAGGDSAGKDQFLLKPKAVAALATSEQVMKGVAAKLGYDGDVRALISEVRASADDGSGVIGVTARRHSPAQAEALADAVGEELINQVDQARASGRQAAIEAANDRAAELTEAGLDAEAARARQEAQDLTAGEGVTGVLSLQQAQAHVVGSGVAAAVPAWLGWLLTLLVLGAGAVGLALFVDRFDTRLADEAAGLGLPVLAVVDAPFEGEPPGGDANGVRAKRYRSVLADLQRRLPPRPASQLVSFVVPTVPGGVALTVAPLTTELDDSNVVAVDLAAAAARSGMQALILDCEAPTGEPHGEGPGVSDVLAGRTHLADVCRATSIPGVLFAPGGEFPYEQEFTPEGLARIVREGRALADVVVLKASAIATANGSATAAMSASDGVVVVCRGGTASTEAGKQARSRVNSHISGASGVVVTAPPPPRPVRWLEQRFVAGTEADRRRTRRNALEWGGTLVAMFVLFLLLRSFVMASFTIPTGSMAPYLEPGDRVLVSKLSYRLHDINRGDVVVFDRPLPFLNERTLIKRVVALPGETVESRDGKLFVNDSPLPERYLRAGTRTEGVSRQKVPAGSYWVMGDNRLNSADSRFFGPMKRNLVVGRAFFHLWRPPFGFM